jgi:hypothetical protein
MFRPSGALWVTVAGLSFALARPPEVSAIEHPIGVHPSFSPWYILETLEGIDARTLRALRAERPPPLADPAAAFALVPGVGSRDLDRWTPWLNPALPVRLFSATTPSPPSFASLSTKTGSHTISRPADSSPKTVAESRRSE